MARVQKPLIIIRAERNEEGDLTMLVKSDIIEAHWQKLNAQPTEIAGIASLKAYKNDKLMKQVRLVGIEFGGFGMWDRYGGDYINTILLAEGLKDGVTITIKAKDRLFDAYTIETYQTAIQNAAQNIYCNLINPFVREQRVILETEVSDTEPVAVAPAEPTESPF